MKSSYRPKVTWDEYYRRWNVSSETYDTHQYAVKVCYADDTLTCNCPWGRGRAKATKKPCKHVIAVEQWLEKLPESERVQYLSK